MIKSKKDLKEYLDYEKKLYQKKRIKLYGPVLSESSIAWKYVCLLRYEEFHFNSNHYLRALFYRFLKVKLGRARLLSFGINVVDKGLMLHHPHNIMCNAKKIGKNCSIQFNVSLVAGGHDGGIPTVGDDVAIGVGSVILGDIYIGNGIAIGANSTVNKSFIEDNICIAGSPARKISNNGSKTWGGKKMMVEATKNKQLPK